MSWYNPLTWTSDFVNWASDEMGLTDTKGAKKAEKDAKKAIEEMARQNELYKEEGLAAISGLKEKDRASEAIEQARAARDAIGQYDWEEAVNKFMNPYLEKQISAASKAIQGSAANRGGLFSSQTADSIAQKAAELQGNAYNDALKAAQFELQSKLGADKDLTSTILGAGTQDINLLDKELGVIDTYHSGQQGAQGLRFQQDVAKANQNKTGMQYLLDLGTSVLKSQTPGAEALK